MRLQLKPALARAWRGPAELQLGLSPARGTVLEGVTAPDVAVLDRLGDGLDPHRLGALPGGGPRALGLIQHLRDAGLLVESRTARRVLARLGPARHRLAPDAAARSLVLEDAGDGWEVVAARAARRVVVTHGGRTGTLLATTLAAAGVGHVVVSDGRPVHPSDAGPGAALPADAGRPRGEVARERVAVWAPGPRPRHALPVEPPDLRATEPPPDLVVQLDHAVADAPRARALRDAGLPVLSVVIRDDDALVGPLVPAAPGAGACLDCLDRHRGDLDPAWPWLLPQLRGAEGGEETALAVVVAGLAALQVLAHLDGAIPAALGATLEVGLPQGVPARRRWTVHPSCPGHPSGPAPELGSVPGAVPGDPWVARNAAAVTMAQ